MKRILLITSLLSFAAQAPVHAASQLANVATAGSTQETAKSLWSAITQDAKTIWNQQNTPSQVAAWANDPVTKAVGQKFSSAAATDAQALGKAADEAAKQYGHLVPPVVAGVSLITAGMSAKGLYTFAKNKKTFGSCVKAITSTAVLGGSLFALYASIACMLGKQYLGIKIMKRILLVTSLLSFAAQAPMHAVESKLLAWAQDDVTKAMVKEGVSSFKTDAKVLASASWNMLKSAYEALPSKQTILKNASKLIEKNPKAVAGGLIFAAIAAPTIAAVRAESNNEKNKTQEQKQLEQLQLSLNFIEKYLREFNGLEQLDPETQRLQDQEQLRIFIDRLKIAIVKFIPEGEINKNLKSRMEELSTVINDDIAIINVENKKFETAYINLKAAVQQTTQAFSSYYDWFVTLQSDVKVLDAYLLRMRQPSAPKIETQASVQAEMQRQLSHRFIVNSLKGVNIQELTLTDLDPALGFTELSQGINQLKAVVADSNNIHYKNAELAKLRHSLQWVVTSRLAKIDKSTVATSFFKTGFLVTLPLMASAIIIAEKYL